MSAEATAALAQELRTAADASGVPLTPAWVDACATHFGLLLTWNRTHNLTRITDPPDAARKHYLDCLVPVLAWGAPAGDAGPTGHFLDVGSGAGFPGLLAALVWPAAVGTLVEPARKRASFLTMAAAAMGVGSRVRVEPPAGQTAPVVLSRATFSPGERAPLRDATAPGGRVAVWGRRHDLDTWQAEVSTWDGWATEVRDYRVDGLEPRCLLIAVRPR